MLFVFFSVHPHIMCIHNTRGDSDAEIFLRGKKVTKNRRM